jgi:hypothetical protein
MKKVEPVEMLVPAGIDFRLRLKIADDSRKGDPWWCDRHTDYYRVEPGGTIDLGAVMIESEIAVFVKVLDSAGQPVESVSVSHLRFETDHSLGLSHITDSNGMAMFYVPPKYKGRFSVCAREKDPQSAKSKLIQQDVIYETAGSDDANRIYELVLSDDMLEILYAGQ